MPSLVTFLISWSVLGIQRIIGFELPMMGGLVYLLSYVL